MKNKTKGKNSEHKEPAGEPGDAYKQKEAETLTWWGLRRKTDFSFYARSHLTFWIDLIMFSKH